MGQRGDFRGMKECWRGEWVLRGKGGSVQGRRCGDGNGVRGERDGVKNVALMLKMWYI